MQAWVMHTQARPSSCDVGHSSFTQIIHMQPWTLQRTTLYIDALLCLHDKTERTDRYTNNATPRRFTWRHRPPTRPGRALAARRTPNRRERRGRSSKRGRDLARRASRAGVKRSCRVPRPTCPETVRAHEKRVRRGMPRGVCGLGEGADEAEVLQALTRPRPGSEGVRSCDLNLHLVARTPRAAASDLCARTKERRCARVSTRRQALGEGVARPSERRATPRSCPEYLRSPRAWDKMSQKMGSVVRERQRRMMRVICIWA